jgi:EF hand
VNIRIMAAAVAAILAGAAGTASAQVTDVEVGLIKADVNGDQMLSMGEVMLDAMQGFVASDLDGDGVLEATEVGEEMAADPEFSDNDADKSGGLTVDEVVEEKIADFKAIDTNGDGLLSLEELNAVYAPKE